MKIVKRFLAWFFDTFQKKGLVGKAILVVVTLSITCCLCSVPVAIFSPETPDEDQSVRTPVVEEPTQEGEVAEPTDTLEPTQTTTPPNTPEPTDTSIPTNTPELTDTPEPTHTSEPTETPEFTAAEEAYMSETYEITTQYAEALDEVSALANAAGEDTSLILDDDWRTDMVTVLATMMLLNEDIRTLDPPERFVDVNSYLVDAAEHFGKFVDLYAEGIDELDADKINRATEELLLGSEAINQATEEMAEIED